MKKTLYEIASEESLNLEDLALRAEKSGDNELADFFIKVQKDPNRHADEAKKLLAGRLAE